MKALALLFVVGVAQAQPSLVSVVKARQIPPQVFQQAAQEDANSEMFSVVCKGTPYVCTNKQPDSLTTYMELTNNREKATYCYKGVLMKKMECQSAIIDRPERRDQDLHPRKIDPNEPNHWEYMARVGPMPLMGAADYEEHLTKLYSKAVEPCYRAQLKGIDDVILWLGRVNKKGKLAKTWVGPKSPFADCLSNNLKVGMTMGKPPKWNDGEVKKEGYPIKYEWNLKLLREYWAQQEKAKK
jgi:hypothetical protein